MGGMTHRFGAKQWACLAEPGVLPTVIAAVLGGGREDHARWAGVDEGHTASTNVAVVVLRGLDASTRGLRYCRNETSAKSDVAPPGVSAR